MIPASRADAQTQRPNVILILGDDIGYKTLTCNGGKSYSTFHLDTLAENGMRFTQCQASPLCSPSRFMLLTGKYNFRNYLHWGKMDTSQKTIGNMMKDAGYVTACYGKWQLDGGDEAIHKFGFDRYCLWNAFQQEYDPRYKNPHLYTNGSYLTAEQTTNKYSEDIFVDSILSFLDENKSRPFFLYYPMSLAHTPFSPTPDDTDFATWSDSNIINNVSDTIYYPSMIKYMDKMIGQIVDKVNSLGIANNTIIIYTGDNGTPGSISQITSDDSVIVGQKGKTIEAGTHVPLIVYWPGMVAAGAVNNDLVDFTDFLPTIAGVAGIPLPTNYGVLDGVSFFPQLTGQAGTPREWVFCHFDAHPPNNKYRRWVQNDTYKLYDTSFYSRERLFYNITTDPNEKNALPDGSLNLQEVAIKQQFLDVINNYRAQGIPLLSGMSTGIITDSSTFATATIDINGGSTISGSGMVWGINPNPDLSSGDHSTESTEIGSFSSYANGLVPNTTYYVRPYAINFAGIGYGDEKSFATTLQPPHAITAIGVDTGSFISKWNTLNGASGYRLDVSTLPAFATVKSFKLKEGFDNGTVKPNGWKISSGITTSTRKFGVASPSLVFNATGQQIVTKTLVGPATKLSFWIKGSAVDAGSLSVEGFDGQVWKVIDNITSPPYSPAVIKSYDASTIPPLGSGFIQFRFTYTKTNGNLFFDDVSITYNKITPSYVTGYNDLAVNDTATLVTGLNGNTVYYYRVRALNGNGTSGNSNVVAMKPCNPPAITGLTITNLTCAGDNDGTIQLNATGLEPLAYVWAGPGGFTSSNKDISNLAAGTYKIIVTSSEGCSVDSSVALAEPPGLSVTLNADPILCTGGSTSLIVTVSGGTGNYHYSLSNGDTISGPQDNNQFTVFAGTYTVNVTDDNGCSVTTDTIQIADGSQVCGARVKSNRSDKIQTIKHAELTVHLFPNPCSNVFTLEFESGSSANIKVLVTDTYGRKVYESENSAPGKISFGERFAAGVYFAVVIQQNAIKILKLIKQPG